MENQSRHHRPLLNFRTKILMGYSVFFVITIIFGIFIYSVFARLSSWSKKTELLYGQLQIYYTIGQSAEDISHALVHYANYPNENPPDTFEPLVKTIQEKTKQLAVVIPEDEQTVAEMKAKISAYTTEAQKFFTFVSVQPKNKPVSLATYTALHNQFIASIKKNIDREQKEFNTTNAAYEQEAKVSHPLVISAIIALYVIAFLVTVILANRMIAPMQHMLEVIKKIRIGDFTARVPVEGYDEIGQLASGFNDMVTHMQLIYSQMEETVQQKTKELEEKIQSTDKQNAVLEETKRAMLNLLEDARLSEEKVKVQAESLQTALSETERLARVANQERNTYLLLISSIGEGVVVLDLDRKVTIVNHVTEQIMGYTAEEMIGKSFLELFSFVHRDKKEIDEAFWNDALVAKHPVVLPADISVKTKNDQLVPIAEVLSPIIDKDTGDHKGVIITFRDVREERALEEARISFISVASHQLRTPLTSMRWFSEMLIGGDAGEISEEQRHFIERIYQGTDRMIALVNLLLQIARVEAGRVRIEPAPVDMKTTTNGVLLTLKTLVDQKKQTVDIKTDPDPFPTIPLDQEVIWQVIQNLLSNAIRYSPENSTINVFIKKTDGSAEFIVEDHGIGIPKDQQHRIFEKFFRAENALKLVPEGSGLGMSLVKLLVEGWGGKIWFDSDEGKGTTFHFTIPLTGMEAREGEVKLTV